MPDQNDDIPFVLDRERVAADRMVRTLRDHLAVESTLETFDERPYRWAMFAAACLSWGDDAGECVKRADQLLAEYDKRFPVVEAPFGASPVPGPDGDA